jgi:hypothetical protein
MGEAAKRSELKRAAQILGVTSTTLRQHGWKTASGARIQAVAEDPPDWLIAARENQRKERAKEQRRRAHQSTASRLSIQLRAVKERDVRSTDAEELLAAQPGWLVAEQQRRQTQVEREAKDKLCGELADTMITSVHEVWLQELKRATADAEVDAVDAWWAPEVDRARQEARRLVNQLTPQQARARIDREAQAATEAARHRATHLAQRAFGDDGGR